MGNSIAAMAEPSCIKTERGEIEAGLYKYLRFGMRHFDLTDEDMFGEFRSYAWRVRYGRAVIAYCAMRQKRWSRNMVEMATGGHMSDSLPYVERILGDPRHRHHDRTVWHIEMLNRHFDPAKRFGPIPAANWIAQSATD